MLHLSLTPGLQAVEEHCSLAIWKRELGLLTGEAQLGTLKGRASREGAEAPGGTMAGGGS